MSIKPQTLKGFRDFLPKEIRKREYAINILKKVFTSYGFESLETPSIEYEEILLGKYGEDADKLIYKFEDQGGRRVALRYDQTVPLARVIAQYRNDIIFPFKRYQIQNVWRAENTQKGRYREFLQVDIDTIGSSSLNADAEIMAIAIRAFEELGFNNFKLKINDRKIFDDFPKENLGAVLRVLDKLDKVGEEKVMEELTQAMGEEKAKETLEKIKNTKPTKDVSECLDLLKEMGMDSSRIEFSPTLVRGLDYYTGLIFEVNDENYEGGSLGGGGRYDNLIGMFAGENIPAVGFSFGFDRIIEALGEQSLYPNNLNALRILVTNTSSESQKVAQELRRLNINVEVYSDEKELDKQLRYADRNEIPFVLIVDEKLTLKNMKSGEQREISDINTLSDLLA